MKLLRNLLKRPLSFLFAASLILSGCGGSDDNGPVYGNGLVGNAQIDQVIRNTPCQTIQGVPNQRITIGFQTGPNGTTPYAGAVNMTQNTSVGITGMNDIVVYTQSNTGAQIVMSMCPRGYVPNMNQNSIASFQAYGLMVDFNSTQCGYGNIVGGQINIGWQSQYGGYVQEPPLFPFPINNGYGGCY